MKIIYIILIFLSFGCHAESATITKQEIIGEWVTHYGYGAPIQTKTTVNSLVITPEYNVTFKRAFTSGKMQTYRAASNDLKFDDEIFIIPLLKDNKINYKLVLSGWRNGKRKLIFGTLFLYSEGELFNGIPVSFKPKTNK